MDKVMKEKVPCVTKSVISDQVAESLKSFTAKRASELVESVLEGIKESLSKGEEVKISGFGKFLLQEKAARKGRNPQTGEEITIADRRVLRFKVSNSLKAEMNGGSAEADDED